MWSHVLSIYVCVCVCVVTRSHVIRDSLHVWEPAQRWHWKYRCPSYDLLPMADPAKDASNWTEHTHSDGRRYYYNKAGNCLKLCFPLKLESFSSAMTDCVLVRLRKKGFCISMSYQRQSVIWVCRKIAIGGLLSCRLWPRHAKMANKWRNMKKFLRPCTILRSVSCESNLDCEVTKASSWDKPECLKNADEKLNTTSWKECLVSTEQSLMVDIDATPVALV